MSEELQVVIHSYFATTEVDSNLMDPICVDYSKVLVGFDRVCADPVTVVELKEKA